MKKSTVLFIAFIALALTTTSYFSYDSSRNVRKLVNSVNQSTAYTHYVMGVNYDSLNANKMLSSKTFYVITNGDKPEQFSIYKQGKWHSFTLDGKIPVYDAEGKVKEFIKNPFKTERPPTDGLSN